MNILNILDIEIRGVEIEVEFNYYAEEKGYRDVYGALTEPDFPAEYEVYSVKCKGNFAELVDSPESEYMISSGNLIEKLSREVLIEIEEELETIRNDL